MLELPFQYQLQQQSETESLHASIKAKTGSLGNITKQINEFKGCFCAASSQNKNMGTVMSKIQPPV